MFIMAGGRGTGALNRTGRAWGRVEAGDIRRDGRGY